MVSGVPENRNDAKLDKEHNIVLASSFADGPIWGVVVVCLLWGFYILASCGIDFHSYGGI